MTAPHSNPNPTLRRQIRNWFLTTLSALLLSASEAGLRAQFPAVTPGENGATPATRAGEIELARSQRAPHLEPEVKNRGTRSPEKSRIFGWRRAVLAAPQGLGLRLGGTIVGSCLTLCPEYDTPLAQQSRHPWRPAFRRQLSCGVFNLQRCPGRCRCFTGLRAGFKDREMGEEGLLIRVAANCYSRRFGEKNK